MIEKFNINNYTIHTNERGLLAEKTCKFNLPYKDGKQQTFSTKYYYDNLDRVVKVSSPAGVYKYFYNREGKISSLRFGKNVVVKYTYDKA